MIDDLKRASAAYEREGYARAQRGVLARIKIGHALMQDKHNHKYPMLIVTQPGKLTLLGVDHTDLDLLAPLDRFEEILHQQLERRWIWAGPMAHLLH